MQEKIMALARELCGVEEEGDQTLLETLCQAWQQRWTSKLPAGTSPENCQEVFLCAVAFSAAADFLAGQNDGIESFSAGEVTMKREGAAQLAQRAQSLRQTAEKLMEPYTGPAGFCFRGVRG